MTERSRDPRSIRTVAALRAALRESLGERSLDDVNVSELCRIADVRRTTFYTHYESVAELLTEMLTADLDAALDVDSFDGKAVDVIAVEFHSAVVEAFQLVVRDRHLFRVGFESDASAPLRRALATMWARRVEMALALWKSLGVGARTDDEAAVSFAAGGLAACVEAWALSDRTDSEHWAGAVRDQMAPWWPRVADSR
jgi:AcrR family transcriptional regulator